MSFNPPTVTILILHFTKIKHPLIICRYCSRLSTFFFSRLLSSTFCWVLKMELANKKFNKNHMRLNINFEIVTKSNLRLQIKRFKVPVVFWLSSFFLKKKKYHIIYSSHNLKKKKCQRHTGSTLLCFWLDRYQENNQKRKKKNFRHKFRLIYYYKKSAMIY